MVDSSLIGLSVIILAWMIQVAYSWAGKKELQKSFIIIYILGTALLMIDSYINNMMDVAFFNVIVLVLTCLVFIKIGARFDGIIQKTKVKKKR